MVSLDIEFSFMNPERYENFRKEAVEFRDAVYNYLLRQHPSAPEAAVWQPILEDGLQEYLKIAQPRSRADWIHLHGVNAY